MSNNIRYDLEGNIIECDENEFYIDRDTVLIQKFVLNAIKEYIQSEKIRIDELKLNYRDNILKEGMNIAYANIIDAINDTIVHLDFESADEHEGVQA